MNFKAIVAKIKDEFHDKLKTQNTNELPIQVVSQMLFKYLQGEPSTHRQLLIKGTGRARIDWDQLLQYLQEDLAVEEEVKKIQHSPKSATQILDRRTNQYHKLMQYVRQKETNTIQSISKLPDQVIGSGHAIVCLARQMVIYNYRNGQIVQKIQFKYSNMKEKLVQRQRQRQRKQTKKIVDAIQIELEDKVEDIINNSQFIQKRKEAGSKLSHYLTNNIKSSMRGSSVGSQKSNQRGKFRRLGYESQQKKKAKSNIIKIKRQDARKVFSFFSQATLANSITIAQAFTQANKAQAANIQLDRGVLVKQNSQKSQKQSSVIPNRNFRKQLDAMRSTKRQLNRFNVSKSLNSGLNLSVNQNKLQLRSSASYLKKTSKNQTQLSLFGQNKKSYQVDTLSIDKILEIVCFDLFQQYLLVSLFNCQVRLFQFRQTISAIQNQLKFQKTFSDVVSFAKLYRSRQSNQLKIVVLVSKQSKAEIQVFYLDSHLHIKNKSFGQQFDFSAKAVSCLPFGVVLFNQLGNFAILQLNSVTTDTSETLLFNKQFINSELNYRINITAVCCPSNAISFYLGCSHGYVYQFDKFLKKITYQKRVMIFPIISMCLIKQQKQVLILYRNGNMAIVSAARLEQIFVYHSYREILPQSRLMLGDQDVFYVYTKRKVVAYCLSQNQQKRFNNAKPFKVLNSRMKLKQRHHTRQLQNQKRKVIKTLMGQGGKGDFLAIFYQNGEISFINNELEYIGSYFYHNILSVIGVSCNQLHQFVALTLDNNTILVVNLYNQTSLFTLKQPFEIQNEPYQSLKSFETFTIRLVTFMDPSSTDLLVTVITQDYSIYHFTQKGKMVLKSSIDESYRDHSGKISMVYLGQQLIMSQKDSVIVLHRKSYKRKCVIKVTQASITKIRKIRDSNFNLCVLDSLYRIYAVNINSKRIQLIHKYKDGNIYQGCIFNQFVLLKFYQNKCRFDIVGSKDVKQTLQMGQERDLIALIDKNVLRISKISGKIVKYNNLTKDFDTVHI